MGAIGVTSATPVFTQVKEVEVPKFNEARIKLQIDSTQYRRGIKDLPCRWFVDRVHVNLDALSHELVLPNKLGAYKIEAKKQDNDSTIFMIDAVFIESPEVVFKTNAAYDGEYGFDDNRFDEIAIKNNVKYLDNANKYRIPFMSVLPAQTATIEANVLYDKKKIKGEDLKNIEVQFIPSSNLITIAKKGNIGSQGGRLRSKVSDFRDGKIILDITAEKKIENGNISVILGGKTIGQILVKSRVILEPSVLYLVKVVVNNRLGKDIDIEKERERIESLLNTKGYNQTFTKWEVGVHPNVINLVMNEEEITLSYVFDEAVKYFKNNISYSDKNYVMFIAEAKGANGYGYPQNSNKFSVISIYADNSKTAIHELGHNHNYGELGWEYKDLFYDTNNFMDYSGERRNMFWKYQWDEIYNLIKSNQE